MKLTSCTLALSLSFGSIASATLTDWEAASQAGLTPSASFYFSTAGTGISGAAPLLTSVGDFTGSRSFEFIVNAGDAGSSSALMGLSGAQGLKFEQNFNTGHIGITDYNIADHDSPVPPPLNEESQIVFTSDGTDTLLYVNGVLRHTFTGVPLTLTGTMLLGAAGDAAGAGIADRMDGHIMGFASYSSVLTPATVTSHYQALTQNRPAVSISAWQTAVNATAVPPAKTIFTPVSGMAPVTVNVGALTGPRTFEFLVYAGEAGASGALMGRNGPQGIKFEQWSDTLHLGLTDYGVSDYDSGVLSPFYKLSQIAYVSDGVKTDLYVNGAFSYTFDGVALSGTGNQAVGAAANITDGGVTTFRDPLDGSVLRFASFDRALNATEVAAHYTSYTADAGAGTFTAWNTAVSADTPAAVRTQAAAAADQVTLDVGTLTGDRSFEFIVHAGISTLTGSLFGDGAQALKYEQWMDTGMIGMTDFGVADYTSTVAAPDNVDTHIVFTSDGTDTTLYVNGVSQYTFTGAALKGTGVQGLAAAASVSQTTSAYFDYLDGHILGFASYPAALSAAELAAHYTALTGPGTVTPEPFYITSITRNPATGELTLTWPSATGQKFNIVYSTDPATFSSTVATDIAAAAGASTSRTFAPPVAGAARLFFRVVRQ
ncbi:MAG TPA: LamG-like jellyroll fold domain-containing protein [Verrucomicrobiales bacterium]|nr:LamG-like jellyroll fold domain-containing protein [Verrucomicrobiales bacterium]